MRTYVPLVVPAQRQNASQYSPVEYKHARCKTYQSAAQVSHEVSHKSSFAAVEAARCMRRDGFGFFTNSRKQPHVSKRRKAGFIHEYSAGATWKHVTFSKQHKQHKAATKVCVLCFVFWMPEHKYRTVCRGSFKHS